MANQASALNRIRSNEKKHARNRYQLKTCRSSIKKLRRITDPQEAMSFFKPVSAMIDRLAKKNIIHKNKAAHSKSTLAKFINRLA